MTSYILKNNKKSKDVLLFEEKESYSFTPKKTYKWVKKVTILDTEMLSKVWENKINKEYEKLLKLIYSLKREYSDIIANGDAPIVQYSEKCDLNYLTEVSKTIAYVPGKVYDRRGYKTLLHKIRDDAEFTSLYHAKGSELAVVYRLPLIFLSHRFDILLLGMKQLSSFLMKKR